MPRALSRLSLNRGGPRDLAAIGEGLQAAAQQRCALLADRRACRKNWRRRRCSFQPRRRT
jgi:hypothetical protein